MTLQHRRSLRAATAGLAGLLLLPSCISLLPEQAEPEAAYLISAQTLSGPPARLTSVMRILEPEAIAFMGGRQILYRAQDGALSIVPEVQWADAASVMMQRALAQTLSGATGPGGFVVTAPVGSDADFEVAWTLDEMVIERDSARTAASLTLRDASTRRPLAQTRLERVEPLSGHPTEVAALMASASALVGDLARFVLETTASGATAEP